jgi:hypothetical protein
MESPTRARRTYSDEIISRLRRLYIEQTIPPGPESDEARPMTFQMLRKLCQYVIAEGYGELPANPNIADG